MHIENSKLYTQNISIICVWDKRRFLKYSTGNVKIGKNKTIIRPNLLFMMPRNNFSEEVNVVL